MRKNRMMRLASILLVCVLLTTSVISGTFAKYTTKGDATDTARVALFGVEVTSITAATNELFVEEYDETGSVTVSATEDVVAPGTAGEMTHFTITGVPEVAVKVSYKATLTLTGWTVDGTDYCPIVITVGTTPCTGSTMAELKAAVESAINSYYKEYDPGTDLSTKTTDDLVVSWSWPFVGDDAKDTVLGDAANATIKLDVTCTVDQVN